MIPALKKKPSLQQTGSSHLSFSPNAAFTDPSQQPTIKQLGGELSKPNSFLNPRGNSSAPKLDGAKAIGKYSRKVRDGQSMFANPPTKALDDDGQPARQTVTQDQGSLKHISANGLRQKADRAAVLASNTPATVSSDVPKVEEQDDKFQNTARRLGVATKPIEELSSSTPEVTQTAFQERGVFGRPTSTFQRDPIPVNRGSSTTQGRMEDGPGALRSSPQPTAPSFSRASVRPSIQSNSNAFGDRSTSLAPMNSNDSGSFSNPRPFQESAPTGRVAAIPMMPPQQKSVSSQLTTPPPNVNATGSAKELLESWVATSKDTETLSGKKLTLKNLLSQPINGSRKTAINQYWMTYLSLARHKIAVENASWLSAVAPNGRPADLAMLNASKRAADAKVLETNIQLSQAQAVLQELLPNMRDKKRQINRCPAIEYSMGRRSENQL